VKRVALASLFIALAALSGCGSTTKEPTPEPDQGPQLVTLEAFPREFYYAYCAYLARCNAVHSESDCKAILEPAITSTNAFYRTKQAVRHNRGAFNAEGATECLKGFRETGECIFDNGSITFCPGFKTEFLTGTVATGAQCFTHAECTSDSYCTAETLSVCPGTCTPRLPAGATVSNDAQCRDGHYKYDTFCSPLVVSGGSCAPIASSSTKQKCVPNNFCNTSNICTPIRKIGESCAPTNGTECGALMQCSSVTSKCESFVGPGADCSAASGRTCLADLACIPATASSSTKSCRVRAPDVPCFSELECGPGYTCIGASSGSVFGTCIAKGAIGVGCTKADQCQTNLFCDSTGHCAVPAKYGQACDATPTDGSSCENLDSLACASDGAGGHKCQRGTGCNDFAP
jgi:hypothetical protein